MNFLLQKVFFAFFLSTIFVLASCGGGSSASTSGDFGSPVPQSFNENGEPIEGESGAEPSTDDELSQLPEVSAGERQFSDPNVMVSLVGGVELVEGTTLQNVYWQHISGPEVAIVSPSELTTQIVVPDLAQETQIGFRLSVEDSNGNINSATTFLHVTPAPAFVRVVGDSVEESDQEAIFTLRLLAPASEALSVSYATLPGSAEAGTDYMSTRGDVIFEVGEVEKTVAVPLINSGAAEGSEFFSLQATINTELVQATNTGVTLINNSPQVVVFEIDGQLITLQIGEVVSNPADATTIPEGGTLRFQSSDPAIVTVDTEGVLTGVSSGSVIISALLESANQETEIIGSYQVVVEDSLFEQPPLLEDLAAQVFSIETPINVSLINNGGGNLTSCDLVGTALPQGLSVGVSTDATTCEISGTPTQVSAGADYTVRATNAAGDVTASANITVRINAPVLVADTSLPVYINTQAITPLVFTNTGGGALTSCLAVDALPEGLSVAVSTDLTTCEISGTPTQVLAGLNYTIRATNDTGSSDATAFIAVDDLTFIDPVTLTFSGALSNASIGLALSSGIALVDWNDGSEPARISNHDLASITSAGREDYEYGDGGGTSVTISFSEGIDSLIGIDGLGVAYQFNTDILSGASNLVLLGFENQAIINTTLASLSLNHAALEELYLSHRGGVSGDLAELPVGLRIFTFTLALDTDDISEEGSITGDLSDLPASLTQLEIYYGNEISGDVSTLSTNLERLAVTDGSNTISGDVISIPANLVLLYLDGDNTLRGDIQNIHADFDLFDVGGGNTLSGDVRFITNNGTLILYVGGDNIITGDVGTIPGQVTSLSIFGDNRLSGNIETLHADISNFSVGGLNTIGGDLGGLRNNGTIDIDVRGSNTITGIVGNIPTVVRSLHLLSLEGRNTLSGNIETLHADVSSFSVGGLNTIGGDLGGLRNNGTIDIDVRGSNTITGFVGSIPTAVRLLKLEGGNTLTGNIQDMHTELRYFDIAGANTITGDLGLMTNSNLSQLFLAGQHDISTFSAAGGWNPVNLELFSLTEGARGTGFTQADVDELLNFFNGVLPSRVETGGGGGVTILRSGDSPRSSASDAAVIGLQNKNYQVRTNIPPS